MRNRMLLPLAAALLGSPAAYGQSVDAGLVGAWKVIELEDKPAVHGETLTFADQKIAGKSACNYVQAGLKQMGSALEIAGKVTRTAMSCGTERTSAVRRRWEAERRYMETLVRIRGYALKDGSLMLTGAEGQVLMRLSKSQPP